MDKHENKNQKTEQMKKEIHEVLGKYISGTFITDVALKKNETGSCMISVKISKCPVNFCSIGREFTGE